MVQWLHQKIGINHQNPVASIKQLLYTHAHNGWIVLNGMEISLPHNPSVPSSSPGCPTFYLAELQSPKKLIGT
jgi:hypothetical protein